MRTLLFLLSMSAAVPIGCLGHKPPACPTEDRGGSSSAAAAPTAVCNAVLHYLDKIVDQGQYCLGCANCSGTEVSLNSPNSFLWQHFEHPDLKVQFLACGPLPRPPQLCEPPGVGEPSPLAAVFVTPQFHWSPRLRDFYCACPSVRGASSVPLYQLRSWSLQGNQWVYEFVCPTEQCRVPNPQQLQKLQRQEEQRQLQVSVAAAPGAKNPSASGSSSMSGAVCAEKHQAAPNGPVSVTFKCTCPVGYHCVIQDVVLKSDESTGKTGGATPGGGADAGKGGDRAGGSTDWQPVVVKQCVRVVMAGLNGTDEHRP